ncbi:hypothetical protein TNCV_533001 [Trichonephila clavipes]|nr:hypothetical protein TNCV_533001 [Trichonephila clavipes]
MMTGRLSFLEHCINNEKEFPDLTDDATLVDYQKDYDDLASLKEHKLGELALILPCAVLDCPENKTNSSNLNDPPENNAKKPSRRASHDSKKAVNSNTNGGFTSPKKVAKKLKLSDLIAGTSQPISVKNKFSSLAGKDAKDFPNCEVKLAGKYLKISTTTSAEQRTLTDHLDEKREEFYVINPLNSRPQKVVIKGLPVFTEIGEIQADLTSQGFCVEKVAQLTRSKTKSPLPTFMVELKRSPDSPDIFKMKKCCYLAVQDIWLTGVSVKNFPPKKQKKGETINNRNIIKGTEIKKPIKPVTPDLSFAAALSGAQNKNKNPGTSASTEETPRTNENNSKENYFGFNDAIIELRRFFLDYPFLLEMGR